MAQTLKIAVGQCSSAGRKPHNQDFHSLYEPTNVLRESKGIALALADGISSSDVSHIAAETAVRSFLDDYYSTSDAWSVRKSGQRVIAAVNSWLYAQTRQSRYRDDADRGYVCTFSAVVLKASTAHIFHVGDARVYRLRDGALEQLTQDHRVQVSRRESYLARALGMDAQIEIDYRQAGLERGDMLLLATDGVYEHIGDKRMAALMSGPEDGLDRVAQALVNTALEQGSRDNLTAQVVRIVEVAEHDPETLKERLTQLPFPPPLEPRMTFEGYDIVRSLHSSARSQVFLARDRDTGEAVALKLPASDLKEDPVLLERFLMEEWIARRIDSPYVLKAVPPRRRQAHIYVAMEYIEGRTLTEWMIDHPFADMASVRRIVEQIAKGLLAFHRQEMVHQDLRPDNILVDATGTVRIIDFGAVEVAGIRESVGLIGADEVLGTEQYAAPEYFVGASGTPRSDIFSLAVITYQMLTGRLPYGPRVARLRNKAAQKRLAYTPALQYNDDVPLWVDGALRKALHPEPKRRYQDVAEFVFDLRHPRKAFLNDHALPLFERDPNRFWKGLSLLLACAVAGLLAYIAMMD